MNTFNAAALINQDLTTIKGYFASIGTNGTTERKSSNDYTWFCTQALAMTLAEGDVVVAAAQGELKLVVVSEIHSDAEIDIDANFRYNFAIQRVRTFEYFRLQEETEAAAKELDSRRRQTLRAQVASEFGVALTDQRTTTKRHTDERPTDERADATDFDKGE